MAHEVEIPWLERPAPPPPPPEEPSKKVDPYARWKRLLPYAGLIVLLLLGFALKGPAPKKIPTARVSAHVVGLMPIVAIPKGSLLQADLLRPLRIPHGALTKTQKLRLMSPDDLPKIGSGLRAARDLAPERPLFWTDLRLLQEASKPRGIRIHYGNEKGESL